MGKDKRVVGVSALSGRESHKEDVGVNGGRSAPLTPEPQQGGSAQNV